MSQTSPSVNCDVDDVISFSRRFRYNNIRLPFSPFSCPIKLLPQITFLLYAFFELKKKENLAAALSIKSFLLLLYYPLLNKFGILLEKIMEIDYKNWENNT